MAFPRLLLIPSVKGKLGHEEVGRPTRGAGDTVTAKGVSQR
jgi:hypothetical protein